VKVINAEPSPAWAEREVGGFGRAGLFVNAFESVLDWASELVTIIEAEPVVPAGVTQVIDVEEITTTDVQTCPPIVTVTPSVNPVPVRVIVTPPVFTADEGDIEANTGGELEVVIEESSTLAILGPTELLATTLIV
jgi:hypothetical protein